MIFQPEFETLERHALEALRLERLRALFERLRDANEISWEKYGHASGLDAPRQHLPLDQGRARALSG
jgi:hypothetical protein